MTRDAALAGVSVVEAGGELALRLCGRLLADAGAQVARLPLAGPEPLAAMPYGDDWRRFLDAGKGEADEAALDTAALYLTSLPHGHALGCDTVLARQPGIVAACLTPFGQDGPDGGRPGDDVVLCARCGLTDATPGFPDHCDRADDPPVQSLAPLAEAGGALVAAVAALGALLPRLRGAPGPAHVEVASVEAAASMMVFEWGIAAYGGGVRGRRPIPADLAPNCYVRTRDGTAVLVAFTEPMWRQLRELMGNPEWAEDPAFASAKARSEAWSRLAPLIEAWAAERTGRAILQGAQARGIPCCCSFRLAETAGGEQVRATGAVADGLPASPVVLDGRRGPVVAAAAARPRTAAASGSATGARPLAGIRVLDLGQIVAGPYAGQLLAALGADVTLVEPPGYPVSRGFGPFVGEPAHDASAIFNQVNRGKRSVVLDLRADEGRHALWALVREHDVVLENYSRDAAAKLGVGYEALRELRPDVILASISGFGRSGPWGDYVALHSGVLLLSGSADVTRDAAGGMRLAGAIYPDLLSGATAAFGIEQALALRDRTGAGCHVEVAMLDVLLTCMGGLVPAALGGERFQAHPARFVRRADGGYAAVSGELEEPVLDIEQVQADTHLRARGFVLEDTHPVAGPRLVAAVPWRYDGERPSLAHAPLLGAATEAALAR